jgi:drug/metabolite transporter (DMT)-like permease
MNRIRADALLLFTAMIWGSAFIAQKIGNESMGPMAFVGVRFLLSATMLLPFALFERKRQTRAMTQRDLSIVIAAGLLLFVGGALQQIAMTTTSATHGGFLTALYIVIVPFASWIMTRERIRPLVLVACIVSITGAWLLTYRSDHESWQTSNILLIVSDFAWAFWITLIAIFQKSAERPFFLAFMQFVITSTLALVLSFMFETITFPGLLAALPALLFTGIISGGFAFTVQIFAQKYTPPAEAALIMSMESVFAALAGAMMLGERLTSLAMIGCAMILTGAIVAEVIPTIIRRKRDL